MGFGRLFGGGGPSSAQVNVQNDFARVQAAQQQNAIAGQLQSEQQSALQQESANAAAALQQEQSQQIAAQAAARTQIANAVGANQQQQNAALGILDFIRTTPQGLSNSKANTGKLTILGN